MVMKRFKSEKKNFRTILTNMVYKLCNFRQYTIRHTILQFYRYRDKIIKIILFFQVKLYI